MKSIKILLVMIAGSCFFGCSSDSDSDDGGGSPELSQGACEAFSFARVKIAQGEVCSVGSTNSPLVRLSINSLEGSGVCTGTVIDSNTVLTAAHCLAGPIISVDVETTAGNFASQNFFIPSSYDGNGEVALDDVAIVKTATAIPITPMPLLLSTDPTVGESAFIGGFGETSPGSLDSNPRAGEVLVAGVTSRNVIVRFQGNQSHPCQGDSGGPLVVLRNGQEAIAGVVSQSDPSVSEDNICEPGDITLYTSLRYPNVLGFISSFAPNAGAL